MQQIQPKLSRETGQAGLVPPYIFYGGPKVLRDGVDLESSLDMFGKK